MKKEEFLKQINKHKDFIYKTCLMYCSGVEQRKILELKILIQVWQSLHNYSSIENLDRHIRNVVLNSTISFISNRSKKSVAKAKSLSIIEVEKEIKFEYIFFKEFREHLNKFEKALVLLHFEDYSKKEIAKILNLNPKNIPLKLENLEKSFRKKDDTKKNKGFELAQLKEVWINETSNLEDLLKVNPEVIEKKRVFRSKNIFSNLFSFRKAVLIIFLLGIAASVFIYAHPETKKTYFLLSLYLNVIVIYLFSSFFKFKKGKKIQENSISVLPFQKEFNLFEKSYLLFKKLDFLIAPITLLVALFSASILFEKYNPIVAYKNHEKLPVILIVVSITILVLEFLAHAYYKYLFERKTKNVHRILKEVREFEFDS